MAIVYLYTHSHTTLICLRLQNQCGMNEPTKQSVPDRCHFHFFLVYYISLNPFYKGNMRYIEKHYDTRLTAQSKHSAFELHNYLNMSYIITVQYTYTYTYTYTHIYKHTHTYTYMCPHKRIQIHTYAYTHIYIYVKLYPYIHIHTYTHIHTHIYTFTYIHICIYTFHGRVGYKLSKIILIKIQSFRNLAGFFVFRSIENFIALGRIKNVLSIYCRLR